MYKGVVLDIGGRDRCGDYKPKKRVKQWIFADIEASHKPDIVLDVTNMPKVKNSSIDVINAIELFEHVSEPEKGIKECYRVLKKNGLILITMPFLIPVHADPYDYQRWTASKWKQELEKVGFAQIRITPMGGFFTVMCNNKTYIVKSLPRLLRYVCYLFYPLLDLIVALDNTSWAKKNKNLSNFTTGYFIIAKKR